MINRNISKINLFEPFLWIYFIWYYLPITRGIFHSGTYGLIFFSFFFVGCAFLILQLIFVTKHTKLKKNILFPVLLYLFMLTFLYLLGVGDAHEHIRVSFTFWGTILVFYMMAPYENARKRLAKLFFVLLIFTMITSLVGVVSNPRAARILTYASNKIEEDRMLKMLNIGGISFFQSLVVCVPILVTFILNKRKRILSTVALILIFIALMSASFTISVMMFFVALALGYIVNSVSINRKIIVVLITVLILIIPWVDLIAFLSDNIQNEIISIRLNSIVNSSLNGSAMGNLGSRIELYGASLNTFFCNPFGVGPKYDNVALMNGIGYHSQILDDLARYGIFAILFYVSLFTEYFKLLKIQWKKNGMTQVVLPIVVVYILFLLLNPGFTSAHESIMMFFLIPLFPEIMQEKKNKATTKIQT